jgi:hypothetical protein
VTDNFSTLHRMAKKVFKLEVTNEFDFLMAGIVCPYKDYRLCFELNDTLGTHFKRNEDYTLHLGKPGAVAKFSFYSFTNKFGELFYVLANKSVSATLIPEKPAFDYFVIVKNYGAYFSFEDFLKKIKSIEMVSAVAELYPDQLKSAENLLFD